MKQFELPFNSVILSKRELNELEERIANLVAMTEDNRIEVVHNSTYHYRGKDVVLKRLVDHVESLKSENSKLQEQNSELYHLYHELHITQKASSRCINQLQRERRALEADNIALKNELAEQKRNWFARLFT